MSKVNDLTKFLNSVSDGAMEKLLSGDTLVVSEDVAKALLVLNLNLVLNIKYLGDNFGISLYRSVLTNALLQPHVPPRKGVLDILNDIPRLMDPSNDTHKLIIEKRFSEDVIYICNELGVKIMDHRENYCGLGGIAPGKGKDFLYYEPNGKLRDLSNYNLGSYLKRHGILS